VIVITLGVVLVLVGVVSWAVEDVYGSGTNFLVAVDPDGSATVYDDGDSGRVVVFEGTEEQAREYMGGAARPGEELRPARGGRGGGRGAHRLGYLRSTAKG
jgi:hypothetical protein